MADVLEISRKRCELIHRIRDYLLYPFVRRLCPFVRRLNLVFRPLAAPGDR
jgi:hypothetical protein